MITVNPQGQIRLCKTPLENDYKNQLTFNNATDQFNYFNSKVQHRFDNYTYIKKDNVIKVGVHIDEIIDCNYLFYQNVGFPKAKYYYCFITDMRYVNENCTEITFETDCFQTWLFQIKYNKCFVEREHTNDDTIGKNTLPENLETGEYIIDNYSKFTDLEELVYVMQVTEYTNGVKPLATNYGGIWCAGGAYVFTNIRDLINVIQAYPEEAKADAIINVYTCPKAIINLDGINGSLQFAGQDNPYYLQQQIDKPNSLKGYIPKNKKLLTFPYCYLSVSNNSGSSNNYQYELFNNIDMYPNKCVFNIAGVPVVGASIKCSPLNYKNNQEYDTEEEGLMCGKFPTLSWSKDEYTNWLTQNAVNLGLGVTNNLISGVMNPTASGVIGTATGIAGILAQVYQHSLTPNSAKGNTNGGDINTCSNNNTFIFSKMCIKPEYARIIDDYFSIFGYKTNLVKSPNIKGRKNWNYVKTIDCNFSGDIPQTDINIIKAMFNGGCTLWHDPNTIYDYSQPNNIV